MYKKLFAFTLAEVLLTMTIVGVVAAMTIPTLHYSRAKKEYSAKLKNFYSRVNNAILDMEIDKGSFRNLSPVTDPDIAKAKNKGFQWWLDYIDPYMGHASIIDNANKKVIYFKDGSSVRINYTNQTFLEVTYDVNGDKSPNRIGFDQFLFVFAFDDTHRKSCFGNVNTNFGPYCPLGQSIAGLTRETLIKRCKSGNDDGTYNNGTWCVKLLENDQWEFKSDYPLKF